jgi:ankyrin repeat protein
VSKRYFWLLLLVPLLSSCGSNQTGSDDSRMQAYMEQCKTEILNMDDAFVKQINDWVAKGINLNTEQMTDINMTMTGTTYHEKRIPLGYAARSCLTKSTTLLLEHGANPKLPIESGDITPLHADGVSRDGCSEERIIEIIDALISHGADVNARNREGETPLHWAVKMPGREHTAVVLELINKGADVNAHDSGISGIAVGWTPLHKAVMNKAKATVQLLLEHGADVNARAADGQTPLAMAEGQIAMFKNFNKPAPEYEEIVKLLKEHGAQ